MDDASIGMAEELKVELVTFSQHELIISFGRFLTEDEWRQVVDAVNKHVPFAQKLRAEAR